MQIRENAYVIAVNYALFSDVSFFNFFPRFNEHDNNAC